MAGKDRRAPACTDRVLLYAPSNDTQPRYAAYCCFGSLPMKAVLALIAPAVLLAAPAGASAADRLHDVLAASTRQQMSVAPWVGLKVSKVAVADKISWVAQTSGGQLYACAARADAEALLALNGAVCVRAGSAAKSRAARLMEADASRVQIRRMNVTVDTWSGPDARGAYYGVGSVTLTPRGG